MIENIRIWYNVFLVWLGIRRMLPSDYINSIQIVDENDPMVELPLNEHILVDNKNTAFGRKQMVERLLIAAEQASKYNCKLLIFQTYRSPKDQAERRANIHESLKKQYPTYDEKDILRMLNARIANVGGGHQTGGAVDLSLCDQNGHQLDMGTQYMEHSPKTASWSKYLTEEQQRNRKVLFRVMEKAGFVNYPAEWWHFSYGDRMWAAYQHKKYAIYDTIKKGGLKEVLLMKKSATINIRNRNY